jgi:hypothetical protein
VERSARAWYTFISVDDRVSEVREQVDAGRVSPQSLVVLFNAASDAGHARDLETLEQTLELARAIAGSEPSFRADAERLVAICEQTLDAVRVGASATPGAEAAPTCPECGNEVAASALRCRRCGHLFL